MSLRGMPEDLARIADAVERIAENTEPGSFSVRLGPLRFTLCLERLPSSPLTLFSGRRDDV